MEQAYVLLACSPGSEDSVISGLSPIAEVREAYGTFGRHDIVTLLQAGSCSDIRRAVSGRMRKISGIRSTLTLFVEPGSKMGKINSEEREVLESYMAQSYLMIRCTRAERDDLVEKLAKIPSITDIACILGSYEIICKIMAPSYNDISGIITSSIRKMAGIASTTTLHAVSGQGFRRGQA